MKRMALLLFALVVLALAACTQSEAGSPAAPATATPTKAPQYTATPTASPTAVKITATPTEAVKVDWSTVTLAPTWTPTPTPTRTPEEQAAWEAEQAAEAARRAFDKPYGIDLTRVAPINNGDLPTIQSDNTLHFTDGRIQKVCFPLGFVLGEGKRAIVTAKVKFNTADDTAVRFYTISGGADSATSNVVIFQNDGTEGIATGQFYITASKESDMILMASSGWGVSMNDVELVSIVIEPDTRLSLTEDNFNYKSGEYPVIDENGTLIFKDGLCQKTGILLNESVLADQSFAIIVKGRFNSADDESFRFYAVNDGVDSAKSNIGFITNPGNTDTFTQYVVLTPTADVNGIFLCSSGWGVYMNDIEIDEIRVVKVENLAFDSIMAVDGDLPALNENGEIAITGGVTSKIGIPTSDELLEGTSYIFRITADINSEEDTGFRTWALGTANQGTNSNVVVFSKEDDGVYEAVVDVLKNSQAVLIGSSGYGVKINDITVKSVEVFKFK